MLNNVIGFGLFITAFGLSYYLWGLYLKWGKDKRRTQTSTDEEFKDIDLTKILDTSNDNNYLHGVTDRYKWSQNEREVEMIVDIRGSSGSITKKDVVCFIKSTSLKIAVHGKVLLEGDFYAAVDPDECNWQIDTAVGTQTIWITLYKRVPTVRNQHWKCVLLGDAEVDTSKLGMPVFKIGDDVQMKDALEKVRDFKKTT